MNRTIVFFCLAAFFVRADAQVSKVTTSLTEVIGIATGEAPVALIAHTRLSNNFWRYQSFLADFRPQLNFVGASNLDRSIDNIVLPDGKEAFVNRSYIRSELGVELTQQIGATGGSIYARTGLQRIDLLAGVQTKSYLSTPLVVGFFQPLFNFNRDKWDRQIQSINYEFSRKQYAEQREQIAYDAVDLFFKLYVSQLNLAEAQRQKIYADSLYQISVGRFELGRIAETDLLQIELRSKNADTEVSTELLNYQSANQELRNYIGVKEDVEFDLLDPAVLEQYEIDPLVALDYARKYRSQTSNFRLRMMNAEMNMEEADKSGGLNMDLRGRLGLTQSGPTILDAYRNPVDQEVVSLNFSIPIADWGKTKSQREIAKSNLELTQRTIEQENVNFEREVILRVQQLELKRSQLELSKRASEVAEKRVDIAKSRYQIGKIDVTDLNIALNEYETARRAYFQTLWSLWTAHYEIRNLTLYDFIEGKSLADDDLIPFAREDDLTK